MDKQSRQSAFFKHWFLFGFVIVLCFCLEVLGDSGRELLRFQSDALTQGDWYRLLTGHYIHLGMNHLVLNMAGVVLFAYLFGRVFSRVELFCAFLIYPVIISLVLLLEGTVFWYVGLSGVLYGFFALGVIRDPQATKPAKWVMVSLMLMKIAYDILAGGDETLAQFTGGNVIALAHLIGVGIALIHSAGFKVWQWYRPQDDGANT